MRWGALFPYILVVTVTWPLPATAQQPALPVVGILDSASPDARAEEFAAFRTGLKEAGYVDRQNVMIEYRTAENHYDRLPGLAAELVGRKVDVMVTAGGPVAALTAKAATATIPIVFATVADPIGSRLVDSLNRPGGNVTGTAGLTSELDVKRLELLRELIPGSQLIGVLVNPNRPNVAAQSKELEAAAAAMGLKLVFQNAGPEHDIAVAFSSLAKQGVKALLVTADPYYSSRRAQVVELAARHAIPAIYQWREFVAVGGLMSYGPSIVDAYHQTGIYVARILKGAKPADLPVMQPTRFELIINLQTARALGIDTPATLLARADKVVE